MIQITTEQIHEDIISLRKEVIELKRCFHEDLLGLNPEIITGVSEARQRMKSEFVSQEDMRKEFRK